LLQRDLPLWARGAAAVLFLFASWWMLETETLRGLVGDAVAPLSVGVVAAFILRGMHLPISIWPNGPWRSRFSAGTVVAVALVFGLLIVVGRPALSSGLVAWLEPGVALVVVVGVAAWGFTWAFVQQRKYLPWFGAAVGAGLVPWGLALVGLILRGGSDAVCLVSTGGLPDAPVCQGTALGTLAFLTALGAAAALVTTELAFRRLLIGHPDRAGLMLIAGAAAVATLWWMLVGAGSQMFVAPWWLAGLSAMGAGCLYVLSGSLLVSGLYYALVLAGSDAIRYAAAATESAPAGAGGWEFGVAHLVAVLTFAVLVVRQKGVLRGIR
jgi:hypothetical protein